MKLLDFIHRQRIPKPWAEGEKIPWNDPAFSQRMLNEHLSQAHDAASRRFEIIDRHVDWIHKHALKGHPTRILDLGCGPGLYTSRLAKRGHQCLGIDFSPASIAYAKTHAADGGLACQYVLHDIRTADYGDGYGLVMSIFGEFNVFRKEDAKRILTKACHALLPNGCVLLEPHPFKIVAEIGKQPALWNATKQGLFSDQPHLYLQENFWDAEETVAILRYYIIDAATGDVTCHSSSMQAYTNEEYQSLLEECGFENVVFYPSLGGSTGEPEGSLIGILAQKKA